MRLFFVIAVSFLMAGMLYFTVKFWGLGQVYKTYESAWTQTPTTSKTIIKVKSPSEGHQILDFTKNSVSTSEIIFWLDIRMSADFKFFTETDSTFEKSLNPNKIGPERYRGDKVYFYTYDDLKILASDLNLMTDFFKEFPNQKFILNIIDNAQNIHSALIHQIESEKIENRILLQSDVDIILKTLKTERPLWLYGTSFPELNRLLTFESLGLEAVPQIKADVWISPLTYKNRPLINQPLVHEIRRRKKYLYLGPLLDERQVQEALRYKPDGLILNHWELIKEIRTDGNTF